MNALPTRQAARAAAWVLDAMFAERPNPADALVRLAADLPSTEQRAIALANCLADLRHFADANALDFNQALDQSAEFHDTDYAIPDEDA